MPMINEGTLKKILLAIAMPMVARGNDSRPTSKHAQSECDESLKSSYPDVNVNFL